MCCAFSDIEDEACAHTPSFKQHMPQVMLLETLPITPRYSLFAQLGSTTCHPVYGLTRLREQ